MAYPKPRPIELAITIFCTLVMFRLITVTTAYSANPKSKDADSAVQNTFSKSNSYKQLRKVIHPTK